MLERGRTELKTRSPEGCDPSRGSREKPPLPSFQLPEATPNPIRKASFRFQSQQLGTVYFSRHV